MKFLGNWSWYSVDKPKWKAKRARAIGKCYQYDSFPICLEYKHKLLINGSDYAFYIIILRQISLAKQLPLFLSG